MAQKLPPREAAMLRWRWLWMRQSNPFTFVLFFRGKKNHRWAKSQRQTNRRGLIQDIPKVHGSFYWARPRFVKFADIVAPGHIAPWGQSHDNRCGHNYGFIHPSLLASNAAPCCNHIYLVQTMFGRQFQNGMKSKSSVEFYEIVTIAERSVCDAKKYKKYI